jgi:hypothetical protein
MTKTPVGIGHNAALVENERKALFFSHARDRVRIDAEIKKLRDQRKTAGKLAQSEGIQLADLDYAIKAMEAEDKKTISNRYASQGEILDWLGIIPGFQPDMFKDRMPALERITRDGELAGLMGKDRTSGYAAGSDEDKHWSGGWDSGQKIMRENLESAMLKRNEAKKAEAAELIKAQQPEPDPNEPPLFADDAPEEAPARRPEDGDEPSASDKEVAPPKPPKRPKLALVDEKTNAEVEAGRQKSAQF